jgi:hypothetical protein
VTTPEVVDPPSHAADADSVPHRSRPATGSALSNLELALKLCEMQLSVIPAGRDKAPCVKWTPYQIERPSADQIRAWDARFHPPVWGVCTGAISGRVVIDFDGAGGEATRDNCFGNLRPHVHTPSGGAHIHVACPPFPMKTLNHKTSKEAPWAREFPGADIRADGGFEALIGATDKGSYKILRDLKPYPWDALPWEFRRYFEPKTESGRLQRDGCGIRASAISVTNRALEHQGPTGTVHGG